MEKVGVTEKTFLSFSFRNGVRGTLVSRRSIRRSTVVRFTIFLFSTGVGVPRHTQGTFLRDFREPFTWFTMYVYGSLNKNPTFVCPGNSTEVVRLR